MKLKPTIAMPLAKAANGVPLNEKEAQTLRALSEWILRGCPVKAADEGTWSYDDTLTDVPLPQVDDPNNAPWSRAQFAAKIRDAA